MEPIFAPFAPIKYRIQYSFDGGFITTSRTFLRNEAIKFMRALNDFPEYHKNAKLIPA